MIFGLKQAGLQKKKRLVEYMETLFESVYVRDEKVAKETFRYFYFQRKVLIA